MTPAPQLQWTDDEVMTEIEDAFDRGLAAAEATIDMKKHDAAIAAQARDKTILEIWEHIKGHCDPMAEDYFESLRTEAPK